MLANNENGYILPIARAFAAIKRKYPNVLTHCDCVQAYMKIPVNAKRLNAINEGKLPSKAAPGTKVYELIEVLKPYLEEEW